MTRPFFYPYEHANQVGQSTHESQKGFEQSLGIHGYIKKIRASRNSHCTAMLKPGDMKNRTLDQGGPSLIESMLG